MLNLSLKELKLIAEIEVLQAIEACLKVDY